LAGDGAFHELLKMADEQLPSWRIERFNHLALDVVAKAVIIVLHPVEELANGFLGR
jgi:hypothetical protein